MRNSRGFLAPCALLVGSAAVFTAAHSLTAAAQSALPNPVVARADSLFRAKNYSASANAYRDLSTGSPQTGVYWLRYAVSLHLSGQRQAAVEPYRKAIGLKMGVPAMYNYAALNALMGASDSAFYWLNQAVTNGFFNEASLVGDSDLVSLHADPRYEQLRTRIRVAAAPCMSRSESRQFDFWVGEWDVTNVSDQPVGKSSVQLLLGGCALLENWSAASGGAGKSLNSYNPHLKMWQQFWIDQSGNVTEYRDGEFVDGSIRVTAHVSPGGVPTLVRMTFTPINKDLVRQHGESSADAGKSWATTFDFFYHRRG